MSPWQNLADELARWEEAGQQATLWWRDDDAADLTSALEDLAKLGHEFSVPLSLAVIPSLAQASLFDWCAAQPDTTTVLVHGFAHQNHASKGEKKCEFPASRLREEMMAELQNALAEMPETALPVLVPPWNRISTDLITELPGQGYRGLSTYKARAQATTAEGLALNNCHIDPINWKNNKQFLGEAETLALVTTHLAERRTGAVDSSEITGLLTHHLVQDKKTWDFLQKFFAWTAEQPSVRWLDAHEVFKLG